MSPFIENMSITDLGFGGGFSLWGFRAIASGRGHCCKLKHGFERAFVANNKAVRQAEGSTVGKRALSALMTFCHQMGNTGRRTIKISESGTMRITRHELSIIAALAHAQAGNKEKCQSILPWLLGTANTRSTYQAAQVYGVICADAGIYINAPRLRLSQPVSSSVRQSENIQLTRLLH
ncbi:hypothetical protein [Litorimonas cladophorae]|uniref:hypothetical protein n=1 Tax=Litorimonas cladophorae TaxID=1220491 RepID=UPI001678994A|nr:hypothetical protein [Litorimonas cladophorae]